jgi:hypothetical protein
MDDLVFEQRRSPDTLAAALTQLLAAWATLSAPTRQRIESQRRQLRVDLPGLPPLQRVGRLIDFLRELESIPEAAPIIGATLQAGKGPSYRMIVQLGDEQLRQLLNVLATPAPDAQTETSASQELLFQLHLNVAEPAVANGPIPVIVHLSPDMRPAGQRQDAIRVPFVDLRKPVLLEVKLIAPGFTENSGDATRMIQVYSLGPSLPAVFLLAGGERTGEHALWVQFAQVIGSGLRRVAISGPLQVKSIASYDPSLGPMRGVAGEEKVDYYTDVRFPGQVRPHSIHSLIVRLTVQQVEESVVHGRMSVAIADPNRAELLEVVVTPSGFQERTGDPRRAFHLYSRADSQPAVFLLEAGEEEGSHTIALDFYHKGRLLLHSAFVTEIRAQTADAPPPVRRPATESSLEPPPPEPPPPPDLMLRIVYDDPQRRLRFQLHSENSQVGYRDQDVGEVQLKVEPYQIFEQLFLRLNTLAERTSSADADENAAEIEELTAIGQNLFRELLPPALREKEYWRVKQLREEGKIRSLLILSDEPWIPWELLKPFHQDRERNQIFEDGFLAEAFALARWFTKRGVAPATDIRAARLVAPTADLAYSEFERTFFETLKAQGIEVGQVLSTRAGLFDAFKTARIKLLHVAAHGNFKYTNPNDSALELDNGEYLRPEDLAPVRTPVLRQERPLVFLNACHGAQVAFSLTGLGGWAERMVADIGVSAFVGALWAINDQLAAKFAIRFYQELMQDKRLAEAFHAARLSIRDEAPGNSTWLAYTLYADPNAQVTWSGLRK